MRTIVVSDLHLGSPFHADLTRRPELRACLLAALGPGDRLVILGDGLELRHTPQREVARIASPLFAEAGEILGPEGEILVLAGNHEHGLIAGWINTSLEREPPGFLSPQHRIEPSEAGSLARDFAQVALPARLTLAYPGVWLRDDVYATHGHYMDAHTTIPTLERLAVGTMARWAARLPNEHASIDDYEAAVAPLYAWLHQIAQRSERSVSASSAGLSAGIWKAMAGEGRKTNPWRAMALRTGYAAAVSGLKAAGFGPLDRGLSGPALRRGGLYGIGEVLRRLELTPAYLLFGHTHRSGPWPEDDPAEWMTERGTRLVNTGSWVYQRHFLPDAPNTSPYWPGTAVVLEDGQPPQLKRLLGEKTHHELAPTPV